ncbi:17301_t:CDS:1, partial [Racocetra persica]
IYEKLQTDNALQKWHYNPVQSEKIQENILKKITINIKNIIANLLIEMIQDTKLK